MNMRLIMVTLLVLYNFHLEEGRMIGRFRRDTSESHVQAIYSRYKQQSHGEATYYGSYPGGGACSLDPLSPLASQPGWIRVAAGREDFQNSLGCGMCLEITGTGKGKGTDPVTGTLRGIVHDLCGGCKQGDLDLYIPGDGRWEISFKAIDCPNVDGSDGNVMMKFTGSNPWYIKLQARNTRVPVAGIEILKNGKYFCLKRVNDNYFVGDKLGKVDFPMQIRLTAVTGEQRETIIPAMKNDQDTLTDIQFSGNEVGGGPSSIRCMGQGNNPPYPSGGMDPGPSGVLPGQPTPGQHPRPVPSPSPAPAPPPAPSPTYPPRPENVNFCKQRRGGTYADPDRCSGFIICNIGNTHRMTCGDGLLFNIHGMNCDLPGRVDCGDRPLAMDSPKGNREDIEGQFDGPVAGQETGNHEPFETQKEKAAGDRERNDSLPFTAGHNSEENANNPEKPNAMAVHGPRDDEPLKTGGTSSPIQNEFDDNTEADDTKETSSIHLGVDFRENRKEEKSYDKAETDHSNLVKMTSPKEPVLHVLINGDTNLTPMSSSRKSDDEASKSRPSLQIMVNKDGFKASLGRRQEEQKKMDDSSHSDSETQKPKHTFHVVTDNDHRKRVQDEVEGSSLGASKQEGTVGVGEEPERSSKPNFELIVKNNKDQEDQRQQPLHYHSNNDLQGKEKQGQGPTITHGSQGDDHSVEGVNDFHDKESPNGQPTQNQILNTIKQDANEADNVDKEVNIQNFNRGNKGKELGIDIKTLPSVPLRDQNILTNVSQKTKAMDTQISGDDIPMKTNVNISSGASKIGVEGDTDNNSKEGINKFQNNTRAVIEIQKVKDKAIELPETNNVQLSNNQVHLPITSAITEPILNQVSHQENLRFKPPQFAFKHPLEAFDRFENQKQHAASKEQFKVVNGKDTNVHDSSLTHDSIESLGKKIDEPDSEKESGEPEKSMDAIDGTTQQNSEGQVKVKRPAIDILVNGDSGRTTELRMRNSNNEIARLNDAGGKQAVNRNPVIGITIRQKGGPDHHILFSKRQRLLNDKLRYHHKHH